MKICSLTIDQFKKFTSPITLQGFEDGLNVISGPNEMGKSTILEAIHAVLFERHKSKNSVVKSFQHTQNDTAPTITLVFELHNQVYTIEKKFIKSPYAKLTMPGKIVDGDEAEETLQQLLGFSQSGKSGASPETLGLWSALWVRQGESLYAQLSDLACNTIQTCIETEIGILTTDQKGQSLLPAIETALSEMIDKRDKPKARYKDVNDQLAVLEAQLVELKSKFCIINEDLVLLEKHQKERHSLQDASVESEILNSLESAKGRLKEVSEIETEISLRDKEIKLCCNVLETKKQALNAREQLVESYQQAEKESLAASIAIQEKRALEASASQQVSELKEKRASIEKKKSEIEATLKQLRRVSDAINTQESLHKLEASCKQASEAYQVHVNLKRQAAKIQITLETVQKVQQASKAREQAFMALQACATTLFFEVRPEAQDCVRLNGALLENNVQNYQIMDEALIDLQGIGSIRVTPGIQDKKTLAQALQNAELALSKLLEDAGVATVEAAEAALKAKNNLLSEAESKLRESQIHAPGDPQINLEPGALELEHYVAALKEAQFEKVAKLGIDPLPSREEHTLCLHAAEENADALTVEYNELQSRLSIPEAAWEGAKKALIQQQSLLEQAMKHAHLLQEQIKAIENESPKESLEHDIEVESKKISIETEKLEQLKLKQGQDTRDILEARIKRFEEQLANRRNRVNQLNIDISGLQNRIQILEAEGLEEKIAVTEKQEEILKLEKTRTEREVKVLKLLQKTLSEAEFEAKTHYLAPVVNKIKPHLQVLFPQSTIEINQDFKVTGVIRNGDAVESFEHLSMGTKEQLSILVRLAFAEMLIEQEKPAALILDDALIFSDDERIGFMFDILNLAATKMQVIVFTCRQKVFESLGGKQIQIRESQTRLLEATPQTI